MSSILRALKKLEGDSRHLEEPRPLDSKFVPLADTSPKKTSAGIIMMVIGGGIVCGLVILAGWWMLSTSQKPPVALQVPQQSAQEQEALPAPPAKPETAPRSLSVEPAKPPADIGALSRPTDQAPVSTSVKLPAPSVSVIEQREVIPVREIIPIDKQAAKTPIHVPKTQRSEIKEHAPAEKVSSIARAPEAPTKPKEIEIPLLKDSGIKLQAVTWSKYPGKRIAVINNRILRQGEMVQGYLLDTINQDDVILSDGGEKWKLLFRIN